MRIRGDLLQKTLTINNSSQTILTKKYNRLFFGAILRIVTKEYVEPLIIANTLGDIVE